MAAAGGEISAQASPESHFTQIGFTNTWKVQSPDPADQSEPELFFFLFLNKIIFQTVSKNSRQLDCLDVVWVGPENNAQYWSKETWDDQPIDLLLPFVCK